ncbi:alpha/beta hydrolase [Streptomyces sp. NPDC002133]|uniref:alpha/beta fold hydrolase n=1 Tax=Streptomyces sp. NPDC002133 TaxID=3154409 RepID=UPI003324D218
MDHWDPAFLDELAREREVIVFDNAGVNLSSGRTPDRIGGAAEGAIEFIEALELPQIDLLGWSMGGFVAQAVTLKRPDLVRRLIVAGSGPGAVPDSPLMAPKARAVASKPVNDDEDFLFLFFPDTPAAREAGLASLRRLDYRLASSQAAVRGESVVAQAAANAAWGTGEDSAWARLEELALPVLVANGAHDVMIHAYQSYAMSQRLPNAKVVLYSDAGHGFLFQHIEDFGNEVLAFLR